jgi:sugar lactone lactonase YvrE
MALDESGRLYICDTNNNSIRRLELDGTIQAFAGTGVLGYRGDGGPAPSAELNTPYDVRFGPDNMLYIADTGNNVIRRVDAGGQMETVAGTGQSGFDGDGGVVEACRMNRPSGINFSADGSLWIADTYNQRVRRVAGFIIAPGE